MTTPSQQPGDFLVIWLTNDTRAYVAEVTHSDPLTLKIEEHGPFAKLKHGDFIVQEEETRRFRSEEERPHLLAEYVAKKRPLLSGLSRLGVTDRCIHELLP